MEEEGLTASGTPRTILEDKLGGLASQFPTVPQLVSSFVARNGLPEPTSIVSRSRGVSAGLVSVCSRSDNGDYHFLVDASDLSFSSNSIGTGRVRDYVLEGTIFGDNLVLTYQVKAVVDPQGQFSFTETRRDNSDYWFGKDRES